jgi:hypothetical protein
MTEQETFEEFLRRAMRRHPDAGAALWRLAREANQASAQASREAEDAAGEEPKE